MWGQNGHPESGPHLLVAVTEKDMEEGSFFSFACLLLLLLASSSTVELGHSVASVKTYFFRIPTQTEDPLRHRISWTKQHPDPWPFYCERAIMRLAGPQPQATLINPLKIYKCALSGPSQWRSLMHQPSVPRGLAPPLTKVRLSHTLL